MFLSVIIKIINVGQKVKKLFKKEENCNDKFSTNIPKKLIIQMKMNSTK